MSWLACSEALCFAFRLLLLVFELAALYSDSFMEVELRVMGHNRRQRYGKRYRIKLLIQVYVPPDLVVYSARSRSRPGKAPASVKDM